MSETTFYERVLLFMTEKTNNPNICLTVCDRLVVVFRDNEDYEINFCIGNSAEFQEPVFVQVAKTHIDFWSVDQAKYCLFVIKHLSKVPEIK